MPGSSAEIRRAQPLLGTRVEIRARGVSQDDIDRAFHAIARVHALMSAQEPASDIARLRSGRAVHPWTRRVMRRAEEMRAATGGLFDVGACGYALDGIAKGFAVDRAVEILDARGGAGCVNAGGDLRVFGGAFEDVYVRLEDKLVRIGSARDAAVATSSSVLLVDPRGPASIAVRGVTVIAADCMTADALTKPCLLAPAAANAIAARCGAIALVHG